MSYIQSGYKGPTLALGATAAVGFAVKLTWSVVAAHHLDPTEVRRGIMEDPATRPMFTAMQQSHPNEFEGMVADVVQHARAGEPQQAVIGAGTTYLMAAEARHRGELMQAPHAAFAAYRSAEDTALAAMQEADPRLCATYVATGSVRLEGQVPVDHAALIGLHTAIWQAIGAARQHPTPRGAATPTAADAAAVRAAMQRAGVAPAEIDALAAPAQFTLLPPERQCAVGLALHRAIDALPGDRADTFYASLLAQG